MCWFQAHYHTPKCWVLYFVYFTQTFLGIWILLTEHALYWGGFKVQILVIFLIIVIKAINIFSIDKRWYSLQLRHENRFFQLPINLTLNIHLSIVLNFTPLYTSQIQCAFFIVVQIFYEMFIFFDIFMKRMYLFIIEQ